MNSDSHYVTLGVGDEIFAAPVENVREVLDLCPITRIPNMPPFMCGVIEVRGVGIPVVDLRLKLGLPAGAQTAHSRIVVLEVETAGRRIVLGALADRVYEVAALDEHDVEPPPEIGIPWDSGFIRGMARRKGAFVVILDLAAVFAADGVLALEEAV
ncbi:chemotaxis protein CheW [Telmatospirillum sp. J64-1]|uniref:chemotaxis protein CheW n=1 Tax=Telmatospirillum sp. J64-1 TaxID=2502183 RepID=UPI00115CF9FC|nr:chemotaxis protein CheW [Telmatospirillum sp. J64-1]